MSTEANVKRSMGKDSLVGPESKSQLLLQRDKDREMVKGIFRFHEVPNGRMDFVFKKYKQDPIEKFSMIDGQVYTVPLGVAKHLNSNVKYPIYTNSRLDEQGNTELVVKEWIRRCSFQSLEFIDLDDKSTIAKSNIIRG